MKYSIVFSALLMSLALSACDRPTVANPPAVVAAPAAGFVGLSGSPATASPGMVTDPSLPAATPITSATTPASLQNKANPQGAMTKQEESMAMPKPGQAGDHSSPALHLQK